MQQLDLWSSERVSGQELLSRTCCFTGHRPEKLKNPAYKVCMQLRQEIELAVEQGYVRFITGMARGVDLWAAEIVLALKQEQPQLQLVCAVPFQGIEAGWSQQWRQLFQKVLQAGDETVFINQSYSPGAYNRRNCWMVDNSSLVIAVHNGLSGGTMNTMRYAVKKGRNVRMIDG